MKVAVLGTWHVHAPDYAKVAEANAELIGVWEPNAEWRRAFAEKFGIREFNTLDELLASEAEAVIVCSSTDTHAEYMIKAAEAKKHIFTEKVLCLTTEDCKRVEKAINDNGVKFVISCFMKYTSPMLTAKKAVDDGAVGKINFVRVRNAHAGSVAGWLPKHFYNAKECGGGAMIDLGAHGMYLIEWLLGLPSGYSSTFTVCDSNPRNVDNVEDNAVTVMSYQSGAIAINETGFVSRNYGLTLEIGGDLGVIKVIDGKVYLKNEDTKPDTVELPLLDPAPAPILQFLTDKVEDGCGMRDALALTAMMEGAYSAL